MSDKLLDPEYLHAVERINRYRPKDSDPDMTVHTLYGEMLQDMILYSHFQKKYEVQNDSG